MLISRKKYDLKTEQGMTIPCHILTITQKKGETNEQRRGNKNARKTEKQN